MAYSCGMKKVSCKADQSMCMQNGKYDTHSMQSSTHSSITHPLPGTSNQANTLVSLMGVNTVHIVSSDHTETAAHEYKLVPAQETARSAAVYQKLKAIIYLHSTNVKKIAPENPKYNPTPMHPLFMTQHTMPEIRPKQHNNVVSHHTVICKLRLSECCKYLTLNG